MALVKQRVLAQIDGLDGDWNSAAMRFFRETYFGPKKTYRDLGVFERQPRSLREEIDRLTREKEITLGDARLSLESEAPKQFDVLAVDAFSVDAIPVHLLTKEAFEIYLQQIKPDGVIAVHISEQASVGGAVQIAFRFLRRRRSVDRCSAAPARGKLSTIK